MDAHYTIPQVATRLGLSRERVGQLVAAGRFSGAFRAGARGIWLIPEAAILAYTPRPAGRPKVNAYEHLGESSRCPLGAMQKPPP